MSDSPYGYRIVGATCEARRLVNAAAALAGYAACDERAETEREAYLSAFQFGEEFRRLLVETGTTAGYSGECWSPYVWFDLDAPDDVERARPQAARLALTLGERYRLSEDDLLIFFSGGKGFHVGLPTALWSPEPSLIFHKATRRFAESVAELAAVKIDSGVYDRVRAFRAPNSRHPKTGLHKRRISLDELSSLSLERIRDLARQPAPFDLPEPRNGSETAAADWQAAVALVTSETAAKAARRGAGSAPRLNRATIEFIRAGAADGDRHRYLFSAAANLAEFGCPPALAVALLEESALDCGLVPKEVRRQIECGLAAVGSQPTIQESALAAQSAPNESTVTEPPEPPVNGPGDARGPSCQLAVSATAPPRDNVRAMLARHWAGASTLAEPPSLPTDPPPLRCSCDRGGWADGPIIDGRIRTICSICGRFVGYRPAEEPTP